MPNKHAQSEEKSERASERASERRNEAKRDKEIKARVPRDKGRPTDRGMNYGSLRITTHTPP
jgi:hypothetical protein